MVPLPVIVGFGGVNPAGRVSFHHSYRRTILDALDAKGQATTYQSLAVLMGLQKQLRDAPDATKDYIENHTLIRRIELWDPDHIDVHSRANLKAKDGSPLVIRMSQKQLPTEIPESWQVNPVDNGDVEVAIDDAAQVLLNDTRSSKVTSAGQLPTGYDPASLYASRNHPRGLQLAIIASSDAVNSIGIDWTELQNLVRPDEFAVHAGCAMGQLDTHGAGGLLQAPFLGRRPTSKQAALCLAEMAADFTNAYVTGSLGSTGGAIGACATFLYNAKQGIDEIRYRGKKIAVVGSTEAPVTPELVEAFRTMGALAEDEALMALDGSNEPDNRRACRPFSSNAGFTISEAGVFVVLMDEETALECGAEIYGSIADIYVNADGYKKSIPGPGIGNYITVGKALGLARSIVGDDVVSRRSFIHAHGTGTPQNRVTESHILSEMAKAFKIEKWPVAAIKAYLGHTLAPASGDQITSALGTWQEGWIPGIATIDHLADDVYSDNLRIEPTHLEVGADGMDVALVNSKGFGGNNATGVLLSPSKTKELIKARHGNGAFTEYQTKRERVIERARLYDEKALEEIPEPIYRFGDGVIEGEELGINSDSIDVPGYARDVDLDVKNPYE
ncbi:MAG: beta-ketoacyl synthase [Gammaproteobacteria bacterium]|nr:beta-ketoacyl synthase [Gammaproteobacteria bacterium]